MLSRACHRIIHNLPCYPSLHRSSFSTLKATQQSKIPVTVLSGFLGGGKTTLLNHALFNNSGLRIAVIVNDMSEINIDSSLIEQGSFNRIDEELVQLTNGCICCTLRQDLITQIDKLSQQNKFDYILIESTGISEPLPVAQTFYIDDLLKAKANLDTLLTVIDANNFLNFIKTPVDLQGIKMGATKDDKRPLAKLIIDQCEFANIIIMNKCDLIDDDKKQRIKKLLSLINPTAKVIESKYCSIPLENIFNTGLYGQKLSEFMSKPAWDEELEIGQDHESELDKYGMYSVLGVYINERQKFLKFECIFIRSLCMFLSENC